MNNVSLYVPKLQDYWYEQKLLSDSKTMSYNAGYDVLYDGYNYETGCIDFPQSKWKLSFDSRKNENKFFAYIKDNDEYVGYVNYHYNKKNDRYECGIVIEYSKRGMGYSKIGLKLLCEEAKKNEITELYNNFEIDRVNALNTFKSVGFVVVEKKYWKKFNKDVEGVLVKI